MKTATTIIDTKTVLIESEQRHMKEILDARFSTVFKTQELHSSKFEMILNSVQSMMLEPSKLPGGQALLKGLDELEGNFRDRCDDIDALKEWRQQVNGGMILIRFMGLAGVIGLLVTLGRMFKMLP